MGHALCRHLTNVIGRGTSLLGSEYEYVHVLVDNLWSDASLQTHARLSLCKHPAMSIDGDTLHISPLRLSTLSCAALHRHSTNNDPLCRQSILKTNEQLINPHEDPALRVHHAPSTLRKRLAGEKHTRPVPKGQLHSHSGTCNLSAGTVLSCIEPDMAGAACCVTCSHGRSVIHSKHCDITAVVRSFDRLDTTSQLIIAVETKR